jgi:hypothetical protein
MDARTAFITQQSVPVARWHSSTSILTESRERQVDLLGIYLDALAGDDAPRA